MREGEESMIVRPQRDLLLRGTAVLWPAFLGWAVYIVSEWLVHHGNISYWLHDVGFGFLSDAAEIIFSVGPALPVVVAVFIGLPAEVVCVSKGIPPRKVVIANMLAAVLALCALGSPGAGALILFLAATGLWFLALIWGIFFMTQASGHAPRNGSLDAEPNAMAE